MDLGGFILFGLCCLSLLGGSIYVIPLFIKRSPSRWVGLTGVILGVVVIALFGRSLYQVYGLDENLWIAAYSGHKAQVQSLLSAGANPNAEWEDGSTAMAAAERGEHKEVVAILQEAGGHD